MRCWSCCALPPRSSARNGCEGGTQTSAAGAAAGAADRSVGVAASGPAPGTAAARVPAAADVDRSAGVPSVSGAAAGAACRGTELMLGPYPRSAPSGPSGPFGILRRSHLVAEFVTGDVVLLLVPAGPALGASEFCDELVGSGSILRLVPLRYGPRGPSEPPPGPSERPVG